MPKVVYRSGFREKHNLFAPTSSILGLLVPQTDVLSTIPL